MEPDRIGQLMSLAKSLGAIISSIDEADVIVTKTGAKQRLGRHINEDISRQRKAVNPAWLEDSIERENCLPLEPYYAIKSLQGPSSVTLHPIQPTLSQSISGTHQSEISHKSRFSTHRLSPLKCKNQAMVEEFAVVMRSRYLDGESRSELSYSRGISVLKAYPKTIRSTHEIAKLPGLGPKLRGMIHEFLLTGQMKAARQARASLRYTVLTNFDTIYGIGPTTARSLYDMGYRTFEDLEKHYDAWEKAKGAGGGKSAIREGLRLREDLALKMPRAEVEEIAAIVCARLESIRPGFQHTICGGYRRGKSHSNDVDIVFSHPALAGQLTQGEEGESVISQLVRMLQEEGLITHVMHLSSFTSRNGLFTSSMTSTTNIDALDKTMTVFRFTDRENSVHRRMDLIYAPWEVYWTAVVGWTGSTQFERDLRLWAKDKKGMKFDSGGITYRENGFPVYAHSEQHVFEILGLPYIDPTMRNADV